MGGVYFLLLSSLGLAVTVQAQGCTRPVGNNMNLKDVYITLTEFPEEISVTLVCSVGYEPVRGSGKIACTNGTWSPLTLECRKKSCGSAGELHNGVIHYDEGTEFGAKATVTCNEGYDLVGGGRELFCGAQGWLNRLPECEVIKCDPPPKVSNGMFGPFRESYFYNDAVEYSCIEGYAANGTKTLTCSDGGEFKPDPPICTRVECPELEIRNAKWKAGSRPPHVYKSFVTYECEKEFRFEGHDTITCDINSQWSPGHPKCIPIVKTTKATTTTTTRTTTTVAPMARTTGTHTPSDAPDSGGQSSVWKYVVGFLGFVAAAAATIVVTKFGYDRHKKGKRISNHDKNATNNGGAELCPINKPTDLKDDYAEEKNSIP